MTNLIERLERAAGPDRDLDCWIWAEVSPSTEEAWVQEAPRYTSSIDVAITLGRSDALIHLQDSLDAVEGEMPLASVTEQVAALPRFICIAAMKAQGVE